ncbi:hypothetical protein Tco_0754943 [Tanacetum coccineum]
MFGVLRKPLAGRLRLPVGWLVVVWTYGRNLSCHGHGLGRGTIIQIFYHGLDEATQAILDAGGVFLYKTPNEAHQLLKDPLLLKLDCNESKLMEKMESLTTKINLQFKDIKGEMKEMRDGCNSYGGPHPSSECDDKPMGGPKDEEANYAYRGYQEGGY